MDRGRRGAFNLTPFFPAAARRESSASSDYQSKAASRCAMMQFRGADMLSITPFLWFDTQAEQAMQFYTSIFPHSKVIAVHRNGDAVMSVTWELEGQRFMGL